jgi:hypothetical protein
MTDEQDGTGHDGISRREFIQGVVAVSTTAIAGGSVLLGATASSPSHVPTVSADAQLTAILDRLVPAGTTMPGAGELGLARFIEERLTALPHLRCHIDELRAAFPTAEQCQRLTQDDAEQLLEEIERRHPDAFHTLIRVTYSGYYSHPVVLDRLGLRSADLDYRLDRFDERLLAEARRMEARAL